MAVHGRNRRHTLVVKGVRGLGLTFVPGLESTRLACANMQQSQTTRTQTSKCEAALTRGGDRPARRAGRRDGEGEMNMREEAGGKGNANPS